MKFFLGLPAPTIPRLLQKLRIEPRSKVYGFRAFRVQGLEFRVLGFTVLGFRA